MSMSIGYRPPAGDRAAHDALAALRARYLSRLAELARRIVETIHRHDRIRHAVPASLLCGVELRGEDPALRSRHPGNRGRAVD